jgi:hypothetical protein
VVKPYGVTLALTSLVSQVSQSRLQADTSAARTDHRYPPGEGHGDSGPPDFPSGQSLGSHTEWRGQGEKPAPARVLWESARRHTGGASQEAKSSGDVVREQRLTTARCLRGASAGAEEAAHGKAVPTRLRTDGAGPSPLRRGKQRDPGNAQAVHGWRRVALEKGEPTLQGMPWRVSTGAEPGAVKVASPVRNGGDEETCMGQRALSLSNCLAPASSGGSPPAI